MEVRGQKETEKDPVLITGGGYVSLASLLLAVGLLVSCEGHWGMLPYSLWGLVHNTHGREDETGCSCTSRLPK